MPRAVFSTFADKLVNNVKVGLVGAPAGYGKSTLMSQSFDVLASKEIPD
jgi:ATP/maltotriose-dependent transcriptional regulator MalT